jgi:octaprenyl-diphosphate synthase
MSAVPPHIIGGSRVGLADLYPPLDDLLARAEDRTPRVWEEVGFLAGVARDVLSGKGKRLRPVLLLLSAECAGGATESSIAMAGIVEIVHAASLIHDDVIDNSPSRRGRRSAKAVWGNRISVLLGDYLIARAFSLLPPDDSSGAMAELSRVAARMCEGQAREVQATGRRLGEAEYVEIIRAKTASLFGYCCRVGAATAGGPEELADSLERFGEGFGMAFQVADDILDLVGSNGESGKSEGRDLAEGKWTLPLIRAWQQGEEATRAGLEELVRAGHGSRDEVELVKGIARATGAVDYAWGRVWEWLARAREHLALAPESEAKQALLALARERFPLPVVT